MANKVFVEFEIDDQGALKKITGFNSKIEKLGDKTEKSFKKSNAALSSFVGNLGALAVSRGISIINQQLSESIRLAIAFDKALIGVEKTTGLTGKGLSDLAKDTIKLSKAIPKAADELLSLQQIAGQLGVRGSKNLLAFSETMVRLESSTNIAGEEGAQSILKILNITDEGVGSISNFGSAVSFLGNNFNIMEDQIVKAGTNIAATTSRFDLSSADVLALATATTEMGVRAELSGSAIGRAFRGISTSIQNGGESFKTLQKLTKLSGDQLKQTFEKDAVAVFAKFLKGIDGVKNVSAVLQKFGLAGEEIEKVLPTLAENSDRLTRSIKESNNAFRENTALLKESEKAFQSLEAQEKIADNRINSLTKGVGDFFSKAIIESKNNVADLAEGISSLSTALGEVFADDPAKEMSDLNFQIKENEKSLALSLKLLQQVKEEGGPTGFARLFQKDQEAYNKEIDATNLRLDQLRQKQSDLAQQTFVGPKLPAAAEDDGSKKAGREKELQDEEQFLTAKQQLIVNKRKELEIAINEIEENIANERAINKEQLTINDLEGDEEEKIQALVRLQEFEDQRLIIAEEAALARTTKIQDENLRELEQEKIKAATIAKQDKITAGRKLKAQAAFQKQTQKLEKANSQAAVGLAAATADAVLAITGDNQVAALAISKSFAIADIFIKDGQARAAAAVAAFSAGAAAGPLAPAVIASAAAGFNAAITKNTALSLGIVAAQTVASVARFQTGGLVNGGIISGPQTGDRNLIRTDGGEGILTRTGVRAVSELNQGNAIGGGGGTTVNINNPILLDDGAVGELMDQINNAVEFGNRNLLSTELVS